MISSEKETWVQIPKESRFVNVGADFNGEVDFFKIIIVDDLYLNGLVVFDPDGNNISEVTVENCDIVNTKFAFEGKEYAIQLIITDQSYEIIFVEN